MKNIQTFKIQEGVYFTHIPETKFKDTRISISFFSPLKKENLSANALLPDLLSHGCKAYPSLRMVNQRLEELYGSKISSSIAKIGDYQVMSLSAIGPDDNFVPSASNNIQNLFDLLCMMVFEPNINENSFNEEDVEREKYQLIEEIKSEKSDKKFYARQRCEEIMCKNELYGLNELGTIENAQKLTPDEIYSAWKNLLSESHIEIIMTGAGAYEPLVKKIKEKFSVIARSYISGPPTKIIESANEVTTVRENQNLVQGKLVMGFRTKIANPSADVSAFKVLNALFGGTPQSKLFMNVREKLSLCYYCSSRYNSHKGIMLVESGVENHNIEKAKKEILEQLKDITLGNFSDTELAETKLFLTQALRRSNDKLSALGQYYLSQAFDEKKKNFEDLIDEISEVTREKVIELSSNITLDTIYILSGNEGEKHES